MVGFLKFMGSATFISGFFIGFYEMHVAQELSRATGYRFSSSPGFEVVLPWAISGAIAAVVWFAFAQVLENQQQAARERESLYQMLIKLTEEKA